MGKKLSKVAQKHKDSRTLQQTINPQTKETFSKTDVSSYDDETEPTRLPPPCLSDASRWLYINIRKHCQLIKSIIDVEEVVQHLYFIDDQDVRASRHISPRNRVELLLRRIEQINKGDKWELFLEALTKSNYPYIVEKITGQTTADHTDSNRILRMVFADIIARAHVPSLSDNFYTNGVLNDRDMEKINAEDKNAGQSSACSMMLNLIHRRVSNWYEIIKRVLRENEMRDIADKMEAYEKKFKDELTVENITVTYSGHSDEQRLRDLRQELRNIVYNLRSKRCISDKEKHLLVDLMSILKEVDITGVGASGASLQKRTRRPITVEIDNSSHDQPQTTTAPGTSAQFGSDSSAALWEIKDRYRIISEDLARNNECLSNLTESSMGDRYSRNASASCSGRTEDKFDSAFYDTSHATSSESVHL